VAYLFAGAESEAINGIDLGTVGLLSKLAVLTPGMLGDADTLEKIAKLSLLDLDSSAIPCNGIGIVRRGNQKFCSTGDTPVDENLELFNVQPNAVGFTCHIEPAWGYDTNHCHVMSHIGTKAVLFIK
jgi:hypothetical protein